MTVKELEERTGLSRANIRFYEQEGLFSPQRLANGYRDYSEEHLTTLLRIKLLRQLDIPIEEIRRLILENAPLGTLMAQHADLLAWEGERLDTARSVCEEIRLSGLCYSDLDPLPYLRQIAQEPAPLPAPAETADRPLPCPWRRFFARVFDLNLYHTLLVISVLLIFRRYDIVSPAWNLLFAILSFAAMLFIEPLLLVHWGTTPGKWLLGLSIEAYSPARISYLEALERTGHVLWYGMGLNIPFFNYYRLYKSYRGCVENDLLPWEAWGIVTAQRQRKTHIIRYIGAGIALPAAVVIATLSLFLPPKGGPVTKETYIRNFNYYVDLNAGSYRAPYHLTEEGTLQYAGSGYVVASNSPEDHYRFTFQEENGLLTAVTVDFFFQPEPVSDYYGEVYGWDGETYHLEGGTVTLYDLGLQCAYLAAAAPTVPFYEVPKVFRMTEQMTGEQYRFTCGDVTVSFTSSCQGYQFHTYGPNSAYSAEALDENCFIQTQLTITLPQAN